MVRGKDSIGVLGRGVLSAGDEVRRPRWQGWAANQVAGTVL